MAPDSSGSGWAEVRRLNGSQEVGFIPMSYVTPFDPSVPAPEKPESYELVGGDFQGGGEDRAVSEMEEVWYHPSLSRSDAEQMLLRRGRKGSFLIRPSQKDQDDFSVSVHGGKHIKHFKVKYHAAKSIFVFGERTFNSLGKLVEFYGTYSIYTTAPPDEEGICLEYPLGIY